MALPDLIKNLLESGVHFGHLSKHWNPKMKRFIFGKKKNVYIIDLEKTALKLQEAKDFAKEKAKLSEKILFVGTKKQLRGEMRQLATSCSMPYVVERWVGGLLTNFSTVRTRVNKYLELIEKRDTGKFETMMKKEVVRLNRDIERMEKVYSGVTTMDGLPGCVFIIDPKKEMACVREARKLSIPIIALIDTDADPEMIDYPIPGNDDSIKSVKYIVSCLVDAVNEGQKAATDLTKQVKTEESKKSPAKENKASSEGSQEEKLEEDQKKTEKKA
ncbi:MAG: 30S ribosomal protein S2 [Candidatus Omnitrophica bacterium]|nr:30S ribosomal protein S2 [Candidatus Omnitrophota bacterium]